MKKVISLLAVLMLFVVGCGKKEVVNYENIIKPYADEYYAKYGKWITANGTVPSMVNVFQISISDLENVNKNGGDDFDLKPLSKCAKSSMVELKLNEKGQVTEYIYKLKCEE